MKRYLPPSLEPGDATFSILYGSKLYEAGGGQPYETTDLHLSVSSTDRSCMKPAASCVATS